MDHDDGAAHPLLDGPGAAAGVVPVGAAVALYLVAVLRLRRRGVGWPPLRVPAWTGGCVAVGAALAGPPAARAHHDFTAHMAGHVLLGMLGSPPTGPGPGPS